MNALSRLLALRVFVSALSEDDWSDLTGGFSLVTWPGFVAFAVAIPVLWPC